MQLNFKKFGEGFPVIILHGILGSLDNWQSVAKKIAEANYTVYIIDQRNHGKSPHTAEMDYDLLSNDISEFMQQQQIEKAHLMGHSMGGKVAMKFALQHPEKVEKLIVVDIAPTEYEDVQGRVFEALLGIDVKHAETRQEVEASLRKYLNDESTIQFLMKGLNRDDEGKHFQWKFNLEALWNNIYKIGEPIESPKSYEGNALFIMGERSKYINGGNYDSITSLFPNNQLLEIKEAGHWVHADKPAEFVEGVLKFLA